MKNWNEAKLLPHDASGVDKPEDYEWVLENGIYYPVKPTPTETICCDNCGHEYDRHIGDDCPSCGHNNHEQYEEKFGGPFDASELIQTLIQEAGEKKIPESSLDETVHDICSSMASDVNNGGIAEQIKFIVTHQGPLAAKTLRELFKDE